MTAHSDGDASRPQLPRILALASAVILFLSAVVLIAWAIHGLAPYIALQRIRSIKFNTAALFGLVGVALYVCQRPHPLWRRVLIRLCGAAIFVTATATILEFVTGRNFGIDEVLHSDDTSALLPGRMELATAASFTMLGAALVLIVSKNRVALRAAQCLLLLPFMLFLFVLVGYFYGSSLVYVSFGHTSTVIYTAAAFILSSIAILFSRNDLELVAPFRSEHVGGLVAKTSLPGLFAVPILFGWMLVKAEELEYIGFASGTAIYVVVIVALFGRIIWYTSNTLNEVDQQREEARERENELRETSKLDPLTRVLNRRGLWDRFEAEWNRSIRSGAPLACVVLDLDYFKAINDNFGHKAGDSVVKAVAEFLVQGFRSFDVVARLGGDEFCVVVVNAAEETAVRIADRVRQSLAASPLTIAGQEVHIAASVGVAEGQGAADTFEHLIERADQALLAAKRNGRSQTICFSQLSQGVPPAVGLLTASGASGA